jgi:hypothetical protein
LGKTIHHKMTGWYDPGQLLRTATKVMVSALLGTRADFRLLESFSADQSVFDYSSKREVWLDYVADVGDGWNSTYAVARTIASDSLTISRHNSPRTYSTRGGSILVMGGDEVYPVADRDSYQEKLVAPYECAMEQSKRLGPDLYAIPGNHDWYDGLVSFTRLFCQGRKIAGMPTYQNRSYFALKLPGRWWLWGVDLQLESDIDRPQLEYFSKVSTQMEPGDRVILATAEPDWIYGNIYDPQLQKNLAFLEENIIGEKAKAKLQIAVAGDLHHYRRHEAADGSRKQLITSGGGGAFLHPTFGPSVETIKVGGDQLLAYDLKAEFPDKKTSKRLLLLDLLFPVLNPQFGLLTGFLYLAVAWTYRVPVASEFSALPPDPRLYQLVRALFRALLMSPSGFFWIIATFAAFWAFTDTHKQIYRFTAGTLHALAHLVGIFLSGWVAAGVVTRLGLQADSVSTLLAAAGITFVAGYTFGSFLMGFYLYVSLRFFRRHSEEAFSALHIADYKNFLRFHIDDTGKLAIYPIGIRRVPRDNSRLPGLEAISPELIEDPICFGSIQDESGS